MWGLIETAKGSDPRLLSAAAALAVYDPESPHWPDLGDKVSQAMVTVNPVFLGQWLGAMRPVRVKLTTPLIAIFRDKSRAETEHVIATNTLADYAADDPALISDLLMDADPKAFLTLFPVAQRVAERVIPAFQAELDKRATFEWNDRPLDASWIIPDAALVARIEAAEGLVTDRFAFCQTMHLEEFLSIAEGLRPSGYRPIRFRPYADGSATHVAAVWNRDGRRWRLTSGRTTDELRKQDETNHAEKFIPVDVCGYLTSSAAAPAGRFAALWVEALGDDARLYLGATYENLFLARKPLEDARLIPRTLQSERFPDGLARYSGVWGRPPVIGVVARFERSLRERFRTKPAQVCGSMACGRLTRSGG